MAWARETICKKRTYNACRNFRSVRLNGKIIEDELCYLMFAMQVPSKNIQAFSRVLKA